jgi:hypothetical protein
MTAGSIVEKLIKVANAMVSWLPGGLGMAGVSGLRPVRRHFRVDRRHRGGAGRFHDTRPAGQWVPGTIHARADDHVS